MQREWESMFAKARHDLNNWMYHDGPAARQRYNQWERREEARREEELRDLRDYRKARGYDWHAMDREEPDYGEDFGDDNAEELNENPNVDPAMEDAHDLLRNFLQEPDDLAGTDDLIERILDIDENNENDE